jgi:hypothetical protein
MDPKLLQDMQQLFGGRMPRSEIIDAAPKLNWWRVTREPTGGICLVGVFGIRRPGIGSTLQITSEVCWMDWELRWCRCEDGWWRLGECEGEIPADQRI